MRRYDDPVEVRQGRVLGDEGPEQFLWRGRLWQVRAVLAHWVETGAWWQGGAARAALGQEPEPVQTGDLLAERELWRVEARRGQGPGPEWGGVFDLAFSWSDGRWQLVGCLD